MAARSNQTKSEPFSNVDAAWLHMETPTNMAMITGVMAFDEPLDFGRLQDTVRAGLLSYDRFRQRVREPSLRVGTPHWEFDPDFDFDWHLQRMRLPEPGDQAALQDLVGELMSTQLDFTRPLWQMHYIENYGEGSALISRLHHCIADGIALMQVLLKMTSDDPQDPWPEPVDETPQRKRGRLTRLFVPVVKASRRVGKTWDSAFSMVRGGMQTLVNPARALDAARLGASGTRALGKLLLIGPDHRTAFKGSCGVPKVAAWSQPIPLDEVKAVGRLMNATVNDVLLAAVTGALRRYLEDRGEPVEGVDIRAVVPVSIRSKEDLDKLGNRFGLVFLSLPIGIKDILKRLQVLKRRMDKIKNTPEAVVAFGILNAIGMTPTQIEKIIVTIFGMKGTAVMTNVPGPQHQLYLAGKALRSLMFWVPQPGNLGMGVSILSYNREVILGVATDACMVPDPDTIITAFHDEFEEMANWGRPPSRRDVPPDQDETETTTVEQMVEQLQEEQMMPEGDKITLLELADRRCQALTRSGRPCKNRSQNGSLYCHVHQSLSEQSVTSKND